jgi:hypothetical protein
MASTQEMQRRAKEKRQQAKLAAEVSALSDKYGLTNVAFIRNNHCVIAFAASTAGLVDTSHNCPAETAVGAFAEAKNGSFKTNEQMAQSFLLIGSALFKHCGVTPQPGKHYTVNLSSTRYDANNDAHFVMVSEVSAKEWQAAQL